MQLTLRDAANLISEISGVDIKKSSLLHLCKKNKIKYEKVGIYHVVDVKEVEKFAKKFKGLKIGRPKKK